jgi:hypothetical protein
MMSVDLKYPTAVGILEAVAQSAAIDIECIVRNIQMDVRTKEDLERTARSLRSAVSRSEALTEAC